MKIFLKQQQPENIYSLLKYNMYGVHYILCSTTVTRVFHFSFASIGTLFWHIDLTRAEVRKFADISREILVFGQYP